MIVSLVTSELDNRTYLVIDGETRRALLVDPSFDTAPVADAAREQGVTPEAIVLTHGHIDHIAGIPQLPWRDLPVWIHAADAPMLSEGTLNGAFLFGLTWEPIRPQRLLAEGDVLSLGKTHLEVIHTPGHSPGSVTLAVPGGNSLIVGDLLFHGSVGRTDLPGGDQATLIRSLRRITGRFADAAVLPGHGEATTLAAERQFNPFLTSWLKM